MKSLTEYLSERRADVLHPTARDILFEDLPITISEERRYRMICEMACMNLKNGIESVFPAAKYEIWVMGRDEHYPPHIHIIGSGSKSQRFVCLFDINKCETIYESDQKTAKAIENNRKKRTRHPERMSVSYEELSKMLKIWYKQESATRRGISNYKAIVEEWNGLYADKICECEYLPELGNPELDEPKNPYCPSTLDALMELVYAEIEKNGRSCDLNIIDTSKIKNMAGLFDGIDFDGDISGWDVSNVVNMSSMFKDCPFNGDISSWNVSKVRAADMMFFNSGFAGDISKWDFKSLKSSYGMFEGCGIPEGNKPNLQE